MIAIVQLLYKEKCGAENTHSHRSNLPKYAKMVKGLSLYFEWLWRFRCAINLPKPLQIPPQQSPLLFHSLSIYNYVLKRKNAGCLIWIKPHLFSHTVCKTSFFFFLSPSVRFSFHRSWCNSQSGWVLETQGLILYYFSPLKMSLGSN